MTLDVRGSLKNTKVNTNIYASVDELFANAIDSYLIRKHGDSVVKRFEAAFIVEFFDRDLAGDKFDLKIICMDNGAGLGNDQTKAFVTKDTSYKDDLSIAGIGRCKGSGRIQFMHYFNRLAVDSIFKDAAGFKRRTLNVDSSIKEIDEETFSTQDIAPEDIKTEITLDGLKSDIYDRVFSEKNIKALFSANALKHHVLVAFLHRLVSLDDVLGDFLIEFKTKYKDEEERLTLISSELPPITQKKDIDVFHKDASGLQLSKKEDFTVFHYRLDKSKFNLSKNTVALCAKSSAVKFITKRYLKTKTLENNDVNGFYHIILVQSEYLDRYVNEQRDDFDLPQVTFGADLFHADIISMDEIYSAIDDVIIEFLAPPDWDKDEIVLKVSERYGISAQMVADAKVRVRYGDTEESIVKRVLSTYQEKIIKDTSEIFDIKQAIAQVEPNTDQFREKVNDLSWKYASSLKSIDMANLSQLVVRRAAILEILHLAINDGLDLQKNNPDRKKRNEEIIHSIFFPMRKDSREVNDHDIWILNEEYHYYDHIASDKPLSKIIWNGGDALFESDVDERLTEIFQRTAEDNKGKRPDIAIFNKEGAAIIIEFKAPGVNMDDHVADLMEYSQLLAAKSKGRLKKFYGYLIGSDLNPNRLRGYTRFPSGRGWFGTEDVKEHSTNAQMGELYSEILFYKDIVDRAKTRLDVYKARLNLNIGQ